MFRTYFVYRKKLICYIKFQVRIERVFDKNEANNTFKAQSSEFVNFEMQKWMAPASCSSLFNIVSSYIWGARRLFATLDLLSRFKCQNVVQQLSLLGFNYNFEAICCCFFYLSCTPQNIIIFFREGQKSYLSFDEAAASLSQDSEGLELVISDRGRIL